MINLSFAETLERSVFQERDQNIFREQNPESLYFHHEKKQETNMFDAMMNENISWRSSSSNSVWALPLYRDTSLLAVPTPRDETWWDIDEEQPSSDGFLDLPEDFIPPKHNFARNSRDERLAKELSVEEEDTTILPEGFVQLRDLDIVCGRGSPSMAHPGNQAYRALIRKHETGYLCARRSEKPVIATQVMEKLRLRGMRFVRRDYHPAGMGWVELDENKVYEKVCQSLREGAPEMRRKMLASDAKDRAQKQLLDLHQFNQENRSPICG